MAMGAWGRGFHSEGGVERCGIEDASLTYWGSSFRWPHFLCPAAAALMRPSAWSTRIRTAPGADRDLPEAPEVPAVKDASSSSAHNLSFEHRWSRVVPTRPMRLVSSSANPRKFL